MPVVNALYAPAAQLVQTPTFVAPGTLLYAPAAHAAHVVELDAPPDAALYVPAPHAVHADAPGRLLYAPAAQVKHRLEPDAPLYRPTPQAEQTRLDKPLVVPTGQFEHADEPAVAL